MPGILQDVACRGLPHPSPLCAVEELGAWLMWTSILALPLTDPSPVTLDRFSLSSSVKMGVNVKISCLASQWLLCQLVMFWLQIIDNPNKSH